MVFPREARHRALVIERHAVADPPAPVMAGDEETIEAEMRHGLDLIERHGAFRIAAVIGAAGRLGAVSVAAQITGHHGEMTGQALPDLAPHGEVLGIAVEQQQGRPPPARHQIDLGALGDDPHRLE